MQRIAEKTFLLTPRNVEVSAEEKARLIDKGFFNQSYGPEVGPVYGLRPAMRWAPRASSAAGTRSAA